MDAYPNLKQPERCLLNIYRCYISHCLVENRPDAFYLRPLDNPKGDIWFSCQAVGKQTLATVITNMCKRAGLPGFRTKHSLRATAATRLFEAEVDELITEITGHRSDSVRSYKRTGDALKRKASEIIQSAPSTLSSAPLQAAKVLKISTESGDAKDIVEQNNNEVHININLRISNAM